MSYLRGCRWKDQIIYHIIYTRLLRYVYDDLSIQPMQLLTAYWIVKCGVVKCGVIESFQQHSQVKSTNTALISSFSLVLWALMQLNPIDVFCPSLQFK